MLPDKYPCIPDRIDLPINQFQPSWSYMRKFSFTYKDLDIKTIMIASLIQRRPVVTNSHTRVPTSRQIQRNGELLFIFSFFVFILGFLYIDLKAIFISTCLKHLYSEKHHFRQLWQASQRNIVPKLPKTELTINEIKSYVHKKLTAAFCDRGWFTNLETWLS